jgi:hypothetical protein
MKQATRQKYMKALFILMFVALICQQAFSQMSVYPAAFGMRYHYGFVVQHKKDMDALVSGHIPAFEIYYRYNYSGVKEWEKFFNYPNSGVAFQLLNFNNSKLGLAYSLLPYVSFPLRKRRWVELHFRTAAGVAYVTQKFDLEKNRKNGVISSSLNGSVQFMLQANWKPIPQLEIHTGISFSHFSNGAFKMPNAGINIAGANVGLNFNLKQSVRVDHNSFPIVTKGMRYLVSIGGFPKEIKPVGGPKFMAATIAFSGLKRFSPKSSWGGAIDFMYDASLSSRARQIDKEIKMPMKIGAAICYELHLNKITIPIQQGFYGLNPHELDGWIYHRIGVRYHVNRKWIVQMNVKAHLAKADYIEAGFGYFIK